jgi:DNA/RNA-binding domain of Phe-tRNA-synthetase-like protein
METRLPDEDGKLKLPGTTPSFAVTHDVLDLGWIGACFVMAGLKNRESDPGFDRLKEETIAKILAEKTFEQLKADPILQGFKQMHEKIKHSNRETTAAPAKLFQILERNGVFPHVNLLVDIYNLISAETRLAMGVHDCAKISGNVTLRPANGTESFIPIGTPELKARPGDYAYIDGNNDIICWLEVRQHEKTKVTLDTTRCFYVIQGNAVTTPEYIRTTTSKLIDLTQTFCGGTARMIYTP